MAPVPIHVSFLIITLPLIGVTISDNLDQLASEDKIIVTRGPIATRSPISNIQSLHPKILAIIKTDPI
jgi:hypothetical protein